MLSPVYAAGDAEKPLSHNIGAMASCREVASLPARHLAWCMFYVVKGIVAETKAIKRCVG